MSVERIVILTSCRSGTVSLCLSELCNSPHVSIVGVVVAAGSPVWHWRTLRRRARKFIQIGPLGALNGIRMRGWYKGVSTSDLRAICEEKKLPFFEVPHINSDETAELFVKLKPDLGLSLGTGYIAQRIYSLPKFGMINVHSERLPEYRNAQSVIWPIYHAETKTGLCVHQIDKGIDTGSILYSEQFDILLLPRLADTVRRTVEVIQMKTPRAVRFVCENYTRLAACATVQPQGRAFTTPSILQFLRMIRNNKRLFRAFSRGANS